MFNNTKIAEKYEIKRGDIVKVVDNPVLLGTQTDCMAGVHYAVACSNTKGNLHSNVVTVAYATGGVIRADLPCNCVIQFYDCLPEPVGTILANQLTTLDQSRVQVIGHLRPGDEENFNRCLKASLALED